jgi:hypothetical protein
MEQLGATRAKEIVPDLVKAVPAAEGPWLLHTDRAG